MASVFKRGGRGNWIASWFDYDGKRRERSTRTTDKRAAERLAAKWEADAALRREGIIDPRAEEITLQARRPLADHLADFRAKMEAAGRTAKHVRHTQQFIQQAAEHAGWRTAGDIHADGLTRYVRSLRDAGRANRTVQAHVAAIKSLTRWLAAGGKLQRDPLAGFRSPNPQADRRRKRRMLRPDEWPWLLDATRTGPDRCGMTGPERVLLYRTAIETGLRAAELRSLTRGRLRLSGDQACVIVDAADTKNGQQAQQFITADLAAELQRHVARKSPQAPVFNLPHETNLARMLRADLAEARRQWLAEAKGDPQRYAEREASDFLAETNEAGEQLDFHSLRHSTGSWLALAGEQPKTIQQVMRHSTIVLTLDRYGHLLPGATADAVGRMAGMLNGPAEPQRATGTADCSPADPRRISSSQGTYRGDSVRTGATRPTPAGKEHPGPNPLRIADLGGCVRPDAKGSDSSGGGTRTPDTRIMIQRVDPENAEEYADSGDTPADSPAVASDPDLRELVNRWTDLPQAARWEILGIVRHCTGG